MKVKKRVSQICWTVADVTANKIWIITKFINSLSDFLTKKQPSKWSIPVNYLWAHSTTDTTLVRWLGCPFQHYSKEHCICCCCCFWVRSTECASWKLSISNSWNELPIQSIDWVALHSSVWCAVFLSHCLANLSEERDIICNVLPWQCQHSLCALLLSRLTAKTHPHCWSK